MGLYLTLYTIQESLWFSQQGSIIQFIIDIGLTIKLVRLIGKCLNETYSNICSGKHISDSFFLQKGLLQADVLSTPLFSLHLEYAIKTV
jgi:hypothetical protein